MGLTILLLKVELREGTLLLNRDDLVLLAHADGVHSLVSAAAHDKACTLKALDLVRRETDFTTTRDTLAVLHVRRHRRTFTRAQGTTIADVLLVCPFVQLGQGLWSNDRVVVVI